MEDSQNIEQVAKLALELYKSLEDMNRQMDTYKAQIREYANQKQATIVVPGVGSISISKPRQAGPPQTILKLSEEVLDKNAELKKKLIEKGIIIETTKNGSPAAAASISFKVNV